METLSELKEGLDRIKREKAQKEGAMGQIMDELKSKHGVKNLDEAYALLKKLGVNLEIKKEKREELLKEAELVLRDYKE